MVNVANLICPIEKHHHDCFSKIFYDHGWNVDRKAKNRLNQIEFEISGFFIMRGRTYKTSYTGSSSSLSSLYAINLFLITISNSKIHYQLSYINKSNPHLSHGSVDVCLKVLFNKKEEIKPTLTELLLTEQIPNPEIFRKVIELSKDSNAFWQWLKKLHQSDYKIEE